MPQFQLLFTQDFDNAEKEIEQFGGRVTQQFSDSVFEAMMPDSAAGKSVDLTSLEYSTTAPGFALDETLQLMTNAWRTLQSKEGSGASDAVERLPPNAGHSYKPGFRDQIMQVLTNAWRKLQSNKGSSTSDAVEQLPPNPDHSLKLGAFRAQIKPPATSEKMLGNVLIDTILVSGQGDQYIDSQEMQVIIENVAWACRYLASFADANAKLKFRHGWETINITAPPVACTTDDDCEKVCVNRHCNQLTEGRKELQDDLGIRGRPYKRPKVDYAYIVFFHKYPQVITPAYTAIDNANAALGYVCLKYEYWWKAHYGTVVTLTKVVAHETCHVFGAADEYNIPLPNGGIQKCSCAGSGAGDVPNKNCVECTPQHVACLMDDGPELVLQLEQRANWVELLERSGWCPDVIDRHQCAR